MESLTGRRVDPEATLKEIVRAARESGGDEIAAWEAISLEPNKEEGPASRGATEVTPEKGDSDAEARATWAEIADDLGIDLAGMATMAHEKGERATPTTPKR